MRSPWGIFGVVLWWLIIGCRTEIRVMIIIFLAWSRSLFLSRYCLALYLRVHIWYRAVTGDLDLIILRYRRLRWKQVISCALIWCVYRLLDDGDDRVSSFEFCLVWLLGHESAHEIVMLKQYCISQSGPRLLLSNLLSRRSIYIAILSLFLRWVHVVQVEDQSYRTVHKQEIKNHWLHINSELISDRVFFWFLIISDILIHFVSCSQ